MDANVLSMFIVALWSMHYEPCVWNDEAAPKFRVPTYCSFLLFHFGVVRSLEACQDCPITFCKIGERIKLTSNNNSSMMIGSALWYCYTISNANTYSADNTHG